MAFLDNSGDIVLDAVLTDTGRMRLAKGDGSFKIVKFALADDEINYGIYNKSHAQGSAYYDIDILQTPVLEAFTNNASSVKHRLVSISRTDLLYLPELLTHTGSASSRSNFYSTKMMHYIAVNKSTEDEQGGLGTAFKDTVGFLGGENPGTDASSGHICIHQGLNTSNISNTYAIDSDLKETQYIIEMDNRLGTLLEPGAMANPSVSYIDDDNIASYYVSSQTNSTMVESLGGGDSVDSCIPGPRGTSLKFKVKSSLALKQSDYLFDQLGISNQEIGSATLKAIDTIIRVTGMTTGISINIPIRYVKVTS
tara:strand:+ start:1128 stop:2057 length:930 start_codon:yes stop_codon:yes gene_type:complete